MDIIEQLKLLEVGKLGPLARNQTARTACEIIEQMRAALKPFANSLTDAEKEDLPGPGMLLDECRLKLTLYEFSNARTAYGKYIEGA